MPIKYSIYLEKDCDYLLQVCKDNISLNSKDYEKKLLRKYRENNSSLDLSQPTITGSPVKYINTDTTITEVDLNNNSYGSILNEYEAYRKHLLKEQAKSKAGIGSYLSASQLTKMLGDVKGDQVVTKEMKKGIFNFDAGTPKSKPYLSYARPKEFVKGK